MKIFKEQNEVMTLTEQNCSVCAKVLLPRGEQVEVKAIEQLKSFLQLSGMEKIIATPDLHPGEIIPIGTVMASKKIYPQAIGKDINCGMRLIRLKINEEEWLKNEKQIIESLKEALCEAKRNIPIEPKAWVELARGNGENFIQEIKNKEGIWEEFDHDSFKNGWDLSTKFQGDSNYFPQWMTSGSRLIREPGIGTLGSGNHFFEFQLLDEIIDKKLAWEKQINHKAIYAMIHSGSRDIGSLVGGLFIDKAKELYDKNQKKPVLYNLENEWAEKYLLAMGAASNYAILNRSLLAEMARQSLSKILNKPIKMEVITDVSHNIIIKENDLFIHRKGAVQAKENQLLLIPGSMGDFSYLVKGLGNQEWLNSCSHGAGRKMRRHTSKKEKNETSKLPFKIITNNQYRILEEKPAAYKNIDPVIESQVEYKIIEKVAKFKPLITFKA